MSKDTINVDLPIEAHSGEYVSVAGLVLESRSRDRWREIATGQSGASVGVKALAPAVVAWIERDEWKPLDLPAVGRTIKATLRDGRVETFKVLETDDGGGDDTWVYGPGFTSGYSIPKRFGSDYYRDITAWEYVDEPALSLAEIADEMQSIVDQIREALK